MPEPVKHIDATEPIQSAGAPEPAAHSDEQQVPARKRFHLSKAQRTWLGIAIICLMVVGAFYAPPEGDSNNVMGDPATVPTLQVTGSVASTSINRQLSYHGLQVTIIDAQLAQKFSDDRKPAGKYTLRINVFVKNAGSEVIGVDYASEVYLVKAGGERVHTKDISIKPTAVPGSTQTGFFDFPLTQVEPLSSFSLQLNNDIVIPLRQ